MASPSRAGDIPIPSSATRIHDSAPSATMSIATVLALASIALSTRSATAPDGSYPMSRSDTIRRAADGRTVVYRSLMPLLPEGSRQRGEQAGERGHGHERNDPRADRRDNPDPRSGTRRDPAREGRD